MPLKPARKSPQLSLLKKEKSAYGGELRKKVSGRLRARPLATKETMHLVMRSSQAKGVWSFRNSKNARRVSQIIEKFSFKYGVRVISMANAGNHLHLQIKLSSRHAYPPFIRAVTGAIAMAVTGKNRWTAGGSRAATPKNFWDYRPFTRVVQGFCAYLTLKDYVRINEIEGYGHSRTEARFMIAIERERAQKTRAAERRRAFGTRTHSG